MHVTQIRGCTYFSIITPTFVHLTKLVVQCLCIIYKLSIVCRKLNQINIHPDKKSDCKTFHDR